MNKVLPIIMVVSFWAIFLWGMSSPKVGDAIVALFIVGMIITFILLCKIILWKIIVNSK
jgi:multisubunit Na+/H+ antiporter MnhF subunit